MSSVLQDERPGWQGGAACAGEMGAAFYPPLRPERKSIRLSREQRAKAICATCAVKVACLSQALDVDERYGIWGGLNRAERLLLTPG